METLEGKVVLITGASSGIGRQIAIAASNLGASVVITGRSAEALYATSQLLNRSALSVVADLSMEGGVLSLIEKIPEVDGVVFCAGRVEYGPIKFIKLESLESIFAVNFKGPVLLTRELLRTRKIRNGGSLVYISSISSRLGVVATGLYAASKAALTAFMRVTATECAGRRVRSNSISPGLVATKKMQEIMGMTFVDNSDSRADEYPLGVGKSEDVAGVATFLLSDNSRWITGSDIVIDGGLTLK